MALPPGSAAPAPVQLLRWMWSPAETFESAFKTYGDIFTFKTPLFGVEVVVSRPETLKQVFTGDPDVYDAASANELLAPVLGARSILLLRGGEHIRERRLMLPAFHGDGVQRYTETMRDMTARMTTDLRPGEAVVLLPIMQKITLEVILRSVIGLEEGQELDGIRDKIARLLDSFQSPMGALMGLPGVIKRTSFLPPVRSYLRALSEVHAVLQALITRRRADPNAKSRGDVLSMLLQATDERGVPMSDDDLRDELMTLLIAGHETTATSLCWAFEEILCSPDEQARLSTEIENVVGGEPLSAAHFVKLRRLDAVVKETLRIHPTVPYVGRRLKAPVTIQGYEVPAGVMVTVCMHLTHRLPDLYPDPALFKPERFLDKKPDPYEWLPFGGGDRRCLGMAFALHEMKVVLATMLQRFRLRLARPRPSKSVLRSVLHAPKGGTKVFVESDMAAPTVLG